jgi:two-component system chemotaxis response regulator CheB
MVVDDSAFMRKIISDLIEEDPLFKVEATAKTGKEAVEKITALAPDLVTMDVEMPDMNGLVALKIIMELHPLPVIMLSGINEQGMKETIMALEEGAFDFIRKPSASTSSYDITQVGRDLRSKISSALQMKERKVAREKAQLKEKEMPIQQKLSPLLQFDEDVNASKTQQKMEQPIPKVIPQVNPIIQQAATKEENVASIKGNPEKFIKPPTTSPKPVSKQKEVEGKPQKPALKDLSQNSIKQEVKRPITSTKQSDSGQVTSAKKELVTNVKPITPLRNKADSVLDKKMNVPRSTGFSDLVAIGTSTGGPKALKVVLEQIPARFPAPIVIVQHMPANFTKSLAQRLNSLCAIEVVEGEEGMVLKQGTAYIAPGGYHMVVVPSGGGQYKISLSKQDLRNGHRPSVDVLYESILPLTTLKRHAVLLTGMGSDGAKAMKQLYDSGVTSTIAESEETCIVYGMPRSAIEQKCVNYVLPLHEIGAKLVQVVR